MTNTKTTSKIKSSSKDYVYALGRRKTATARVRLYRKSGDMIVNEKAIGQYFNGEVAHALYMRPFEITGTVGKLSFSAKVEGGGKESQLDAVIHGLSRSLVKIDETYKSLLRKAGLLTRDPRMKESRKVGTGGKARRKKQSPKR